MPITNTASYIPTMGEFIAHWNQVNAAISPGVQVALPNGQIYGFSQFVAVKNQLSNQTQTLTGHLTDKEIARGDIMLRKKRLLALFNEFNLMLETYWGNSAFMQARPFAPSVGDGEGAFVAPMRQVISLWPKLNASPAPAGLALPLVLADGTTAAAFTSLVAALQQAYVNEGDAQQNVDLARARRNELMATARAVMVLYRKVVPARCALIPTLVETLPALTPPPGHTPDPVNASAVFVAPDKAKIVHDASTDTKLVRYELRGNPGDKYDDDDAVIIASHTPTEPREFVTTFGLTQPGTEIALKLFTVLDTGNESGSATMLVSRPAEG